MRIILAIWICFLASQSYSESSILVGKSNFTDKDIAIAIEMLKSDLPDGAIVCTKVDKIYPKILKQSYGKNGKIYSEEKWFLSGCEGASSVTVKLHPSGLIGVGNAKH